MFFPSRPPRPVCLIASDGTVTPYPSLIAFIDAVGLYWIRHSIGETLSHLPVRQPLPLGALLPDRTNLSLHPA